MSLALSSLFHIPSHKKCARILDGTDSVKNHMEQSHIVVIRLDEGGRRWFCVASRCTPYTTGCGDWQSSERSYLPLFDRLLPDKTCIYIQLVIASSDSSIR